MMGGAWFEDLFGSVDSVTTSQLETVALESLREQLNITTEPNKVVSSVLKVLILSYFNVNKRSGLFASYGLPR